MKTKRFVSTLLALLLICSLPVSAFADDNYGYMLNTGTIDTNYGSVYNHGTVKINEGHIGANDSGTVETNNNYVEHNSGTVETNNGIVNLNHDTVNTNNGTVGYNDTTGTVKDNNGTVEENVGTVETNNTTGTVSNISGTVTTNYGTVNKLEWVNGIGFVPISTRYGVLVDNNGTKTLEEYCEPNKVLDFSQLTKEGYVYAGYTQEYQLLDGVLTKQALTVNDTSYTVTCPNVLTLIWQAIFSPAADDGTGSFGPGSVISINGHKFLLVAVVEDVYCLASVDSFGEEQLSDLPALLASLLTEEQLTHVTGDPELLDEELTARFFAGQGSHIVFPCDSGLIFS